MASIPHQNGETILEENPGHFEQGRWVEDPAWPYERRAGHWERFPYGGRFANNEHISDPRYRRFELLLTGHQYADPSRKVLTVSLGTTDDPEEAVKLSELGLKLFPFIYNLGDTLAFEDRQMMLSWPLKLAGPRKEE